MTGPRPSYDAVRLVDVRERPLDVAEVLGSVQGPGSGGITLFVGTVRDHDGGRPVTDLGYTGHPLAREHLLAVCRAVAGRHEVQALAAVHRTGDLAVGDAAVVVAAAAAHRGTAFAAARDLIDTLKEQVPIWKHQRFADRPAEWVGAVTDPAARAAR